MITLTPRTALPSLFAACHEEPYSAHARGFGAWPRTRWPWAFQLRRSAGVQTTRLLRGQLLYLSPTTVPLVDSLCRSELEAGLEGRYGELAARLLGRLGEAGPSLTEDLRLELGLEPKQLARVQARLERVGALVFRELRSEAVASTDLGPTQLLRWDQLRPRPDPPAGLADLLVAGVRAAVLAPASEPAGWFSWRAPPGLLAELLESRRLVSPAPGWVAVGDHNR